MKRIIITNYSSSLRRFRWLLLLACFIPVLVNAQQKTDFKFTDVANENLKITMQQNTKAVFDVINDSYHAKKNGLQLSPNNITSDARDRLQALWSTSMFYCTKANIQQSVLKMPNGNWQVRNIPVFFERGETDEDKNQDIVIEFTPTGIINDIYIAIPFHQYENIRNKGVNVTDIRRRQLIIEFVENFRTAYNRKDIEYLNQVFSKDALIITGKVLATKGDGYPLVEKKVQNKVQYMENLKGAFANNKYINIKFSDIEVTQPYEKDYVYCVRLVQEWNASNYRDKGWVFLIIDFKNENEPQIWVRAWDPFDMSGKNVTREDDFVI